MSTRSVAIGIGQAVGSAWHIPPGTDISTIIDAVDRELDGRAVIDPKNREQVEALTGLYAPYYNTDQVNRMQAALGKFADPSPPEPMKIGTVVVSADGRQWVRVFPPGGFAPWALSTKIVGAEVWWLWTAMPSVKVVES